MNTKLGIIVNDNIMSGVTDFISVVTPENFIYDGVDTLIIGKENVKKLFPDYKLKYLDRNIKDNIYWTFSKFEKRNIFEKDLKEFQDSILQNRFKDIKYYSLGIIYMKYSVCKRFINFLNNSDKKFCYISDKGIYIYSENNIFGVSLDELAYIGIKKIRIMTFLKKFKNVNLIFNKTFVNSIKNVGERYIPYLYSINSI